jgi:hypothetical protein
MTAPRLPRRSILAVPFMLAAPHAWADDMVAPPAPRPDEAAADILTPGGKPVGVTESKPMLRQLPGGAAAAKALFDRLSKGGKVTRRRDGSEFALLPGGGRVFFGTETSDAYPRLGIRINGIPITSIEFPPNWNGKYQLHPAGEPLRGEVDDANGGM